MQRYGNRCGREYITLIRVRQRMGLSQKNMAEALGYNSRQSYGMKERGERRFSVEEALVIARTLCMDVESVFGCESNQNED